MRKRLIRIIPAALCLALLAFCVTVDEIERKADYFIYGCCAESGPVEYSTETNTWSLVETWDIVENEEVTSIKAGGFMYGYNTENSSARYSTETDTWDIVENGELIIQPSEANGIDGAGCAENGRSAIYSKETDTWEIREMTEVVNSHAGELAYGFAEIGPVQYSIEIDIWELVDD